MSKQTNCKKSEIFIRSIIDDAWSKIAPFWPLKNLVAVNPISGFEDLPFEEALKEAEVYFRQKKIPKEMESINRESIKWLQAFFDEGQSTVEMPLREAGLLNSVLALLPFDSRVHCRNVKKIEWLQNLPQEPLAVISQCFSELAIPDKEQKQFLTLLLTTLPGWASHVQYRVSWADAVDEIHPNRVTGEDYLAFRLVITCLLWPEAKQILVWHKNVRDTVKIGNDYDRIKDAETNYRNALIEKLIEQEIPQEKNCDITVQLLFCIDVRSEPFRRFLEGQGAYETFGCPGFFGLPIELENAMTAECHASCPVLLKPAHKIIERPHRASDYCEFSHKAAKGIKKIYQSIKYTFTTPFALVETLGSTKGLWMAVKSFSPRLAHAIKATFYRLFHPSVEVVPCLDSMLVEEQISYAFKLLTSIDLSDYFAPVVVICGHGSATQNNGFSTGLDCGACGGHHGGSNARVMATILNQVEVRQGLKKLNIHIPESTIFVGGEHITTTDHVEIFDYSLSAKNRALLSSLKKDLKVAQALNSRWRCEQMGVNLQVNRAARHTELRSKDWAEIRPEWGLARNAAFVIGPRCLTKKIDLEGRVFLHSYSWEKDSDNKILSGILTSALVVAKWINLQYLFSTLDNVAFGGGSKITKNVTGKIGVVQGNASDIMHGLPLQSVYKNDHSAYHIPMRLLAVVYASKTNISRIISEEFLLQNMFENGWVTLSCIDPKNHQSYILQRDLSWKEGK